METRAQKKYIRSSPVKMRLVIDMIRGKKVSDALSILKFSNKLAAKDAEMVLKSALSNFTNIDEDYHADPAKIKVKKAFVDVGPTMKRIRPAPMGRAYRVRKRSNHLTIILESQD
jgi:large subunit ribosomal protein L22